MDNQPDFYLKAFSIIYLLSVAIFSWLLWYIRKIKNNPVTLSFQLLLSLFIIWSLDFSMYFFDPTLEIWILLEKIAYVSYSLVPVFFFTLACQYTTYRDIFSRRWTLLVFIVPCITILLAFTSDIHSLLMYGYIIDHSGFIPALEYQYGIWGLIHTIYCGFLMVTALLLLVGNLYVHPETHRKGMLFLIAGGLILFLWNSLIMIGFIPTWVFNIPIVFLVIAIFFTIAVIEYNILDFLPLARNTVLEQIEDLFLLLSPDETILDMNCSMEQIFGIRKSDAIGKNLVTIFSSLPDFVRICQMSGEEKNHVIIEVDSQERTYSVRSSPLTDPAGSLLGNIFILRDMSDLEAAKKDLRNSNTELLWVNDSLKREIEQRELIQVALVKSETSLRTILDSMHDAVFIHTEDGKIISLNARMLKLFQVPDEDQAKKYSILDDYSAGDYPHTHLKEYWRETLQGNTRIFEWKARRPADGSVFDAEIYLTKIDLPDGPAILASVRDITARKQEKNALSIANQKLNLLSSITRHDILNQTTGLAGYLQLSIEQVDDEKVHSYLATCLELTRAIQSEIEFTRIYEDIGTRSPKWHNIAGLIDHVKNTMPSTDLVWHVQFEDLQIYADPLLEKVFYNLIENTIRHGGSATDLSFSCEKLDHRLVLTYRDNGPGIPQSEKKNIFHRGYGKNTGFGMFISREILTITGLSIQETGEEGMGVRFEIEVPDGLFRF